MAFTDREKGAQKALKRLHPFLIKSLSPDVRHELYARDMLTWHEQQTIGEWLASCAALVDLHSSSNQLMCQMSEASWLSFYGWWTVCFWPQAHKPVLEVVISFC